MSYTTEDHAFAKANLWVNTIHDLKNSAGKDGQRIPINSAIIDTNAVVEAFDRKFAPKPVTNAKAPKKNK